MKNQDNDEIKRFLISEYSTVSTYFNTIINFRFIVFGFYITAITLLIYDNFSAAKAIILISISIILWILELRNRGLANKVQSIGIEIENNLDPQKSFKHHFFNSLKFDIKPDETDIFGKKILSPILIEYKDGKIERLFSKTTNRIEAVYLISHTFAIDFAYSLAIFFSLLYLFSNMN